MRRRMRNGFTLVELLVTVVIIGILLGVAVPSYRQYVIRGNRSAAQAVMMDIASREQQFLLANRAYADKATLEANGYLLPSDVAQNYTWDVQPGPSGLPPSFEITFTAAGGQVADGVLKLTSSGAKTPLEKWK